MYGCNLANSEPLRGQSARFMQLQSYKPKDKSLETITVPPKVTIISLLIQLYKSQQCCDGSRDQNEEVNVLANMRRKRRCDTHEPSSA